MLSQHDATAAGHTAAAHRTGAALAGMREAYAERCGQLLMLVRDLCQLAAEEKAGKTSHQVRKGAQLAAK